MSNQAEHENPQATETLTPQEMRESLLAELEASKQAITELSDQQLEGVNGGGFDRFSKYFRFIRKTGESPVSISAAGLARLAKVAGKKS